MKKLMMIVSGLLMLMSSGAFAAQEILMVFGSGAGYPPFYLAKAEKGMFIDMIDAFEKKYPEYKIIRRDLPRKRMDQWMDEGKAQAFSLTNPIFMAPERAEKFLFTQPIWKTGDYVVFKAGKELPYSKPEDLFGVKLGTVRGNGYGILDPHLKSGKIPKNDVSRGKQLYDLLLKERVQAIVGNLHVFPYEAKLHKYDPNQFVFSKVPLFEFELMIQINPKNADFHKKIDQYITQAKQDGTLEKIEAKWLK